MHEVEHYDLVFTRDPETGEELLLLAIERTDIDTALGEVDRVERSEEDGVVGLRMSFNQGQAQVLLPDVSEATYAQLDQFDTIWVCWMDEGDIIDDIQVPLAA